MDETIQYVPVAKILKARGLNGQVFLSLFDSSIPAFTRLMNFFISNEQNQLSPLTLQDIWLQNSKVVAAFQEIHDRNSAEAVSGKLIYAHQDRLPILADGEYYNNDLIGCRCYFNNELLGQVVYMHDFGTCDIFEIQLENHKTLMLPFLKALIQEINISQKTIVFQAIKDYL